MIESNHSLKMWITSDKLTMSEILDSLQAHHQECTHITCERIRDCRLHIVIHQVLILELQILLWTPESNCHRRDHLKATNLVTTTIETAPQAPSSITT